MSEKTIYIIAGSVGTPRGKLFKSFVGKLNAQGLAVGGGMVGGIKPANQMGEGLSLLDHTEAAVLEKIARKISVAPDVTTFAFTGFGLGAHLDAVIRAYPNAKVYVFRHANEDLPAYRTGKLEKVANKHGITLSDIDQYRNDYNAAVVRAQNEFGMTPWAALNKPMINPDTLVPNRAADGAASDTKILVSTLNV